MAEPGDGSVQAVLEVDEGIVRPETTAKLFAGNCRARVFEKGDKDLERLGLQLDRQAVLAEHTLRQVDFEGTKANKAGVTGWLHGA